MPKLLEPLKIGPLKLRNRMVMPPMATGFSTPEGEVTEKLVNHYFDRSEGLGLLIVEHAYVSPEGKLSDNQLGAYSDRFIMGLKKLVEAVHVHETPIALQINHAGSATTREVCGVRPYAPSPVMHPDRGKELPRAMSLEKVENVIEAFKNAACRAADAGFDAVEIHGAHGYLLSQFLSPLTNIRDDELGGPLEKRVRMPVMVIERIREVLGRTFPLFYRLGAWDLIPEGLTLQEGMKAAEIIAGKGVDIVDVSAGFFGRDPPVFQGPGYFVPQAVSVRQEIDTPVIGVGGIKTAEEADAIIRSGKIDLIAIGTTIFQNPKWASKAVKKLKKYCYNST